MRPSLAAAVLAAAFALAGCSTTALTPGSSAVVAAKAGYVFEVAYNLAGSTYLGMIADGSITPAQRAAAKPVLQKAYQAVVAAQTAVQLGDATTVAAQAALAFQLAGQAWAILKPGVPFPITAPATAPAASGAPAASIDAKIKEA